MIFRAAAYLLLLSFAPAYTLANSRRTLRNVGNAVAAVPSGYSRVGHRDTGFTLAQTHTAGEDAIETVMFTSEGSVFTRSVPNPTDLPKRLSELGAARTYDDEDTDGFLNPNLRCETCPTTDTRTRVEDATETPWDAVGLLSRQDANAISAGVSQCSGAIIGAQRQHVITAGHCLVDSRGSNDNVNQITFYPALNGRTLPFGAIQAVKARVLNQYVEGRQRTPLALNYDFALITLDKPAPSGTSYLDIEAGYGVDTFDCETAGYPADKNEDRALGSFMYKVECPNVKFNFADGPSELRCGDLCSNMVVHDCLSYEGQSGSAIWSKEGENRTVRAILTGAIQEGNGPLYNVGTQLNSFVYNTIVSWYNEDVTNGLNLAPASPSSNSGDNGITNTLGNESWWSDNWWYVALPVGVCLVLGVLCLICTCCRRTMKRKSRPMVGAAHPPVNGNGYPMQYEPQQPVPQSGNGFPTQAYYNQQGPPQPDSNFARYGPSYYNGTGGGAPNGVS